jgi:hypothetical protein
MHSLLEAGGPGFNPHSKHFFALIIVRREQFPVGGGLKKRLGSEPDKEGAL